MNNQFYNYMKSERSLRSLTKNQHKKDSNSPTLSSSYSQKKFLTKSYKDEPFPKQIKKIIIGHKLKLSDFSDEEQQNSGVVMEQQENEVFQKKKVLPHFKIMSDRGQFLASRNRIKSERKVNRASSLCKSVQSLKLPQVMEEKKEEDELQKLQRSKLSQFKDRNEFNQRGSRVSDNNSLTDHSRDSMQLNHFSSAMPERIIENQAEETKSDKNKQDRTMLSSEMEKIIVDEVDDRKWKKEESQQQIQEIIQEERQEEETDNVNKFRITLDKLEQQNQLFTRFKDQDFRISSHRSETHSEEEKRREKQLKKTNKHKHTPISEQFLNQ